VFDHEEIATLLRRAKDLIATLAAARVVLRRAAQSEDAAAAFMLATTYDPVVLRELKAFGFAPDHELAREWCEKAKQLGSEEAARRLQLLTRAAR